MEYLPLASLIPLIGKKSTFLTYVPVCECVHMNAVLTEALGGN